MNHYAGEVIARDRYRDLRQEAVGGQRLASSCAPAPTSRDPVFLRAWLRRFGLRLGWRRLWAATSAEHPIPMVAPSGRADLEREPGSR